MRVLPLPLCRPFLPLALLPFQYPDTYPLINPFIVSLHRVLRYYFLLQSYIGDGLWYCWTADFYATETFSALQDIPEPRHFSNDFNWHNAVIDVAFEAGTRVCFNRE